MTTIDRRTFLSGLAGSFFAAPAVSAPQQTLPAHQAHPAPAGWMSPRRSSLSTPRKSSTPSLLLTATCFPGVEGFRETRYATEYQILLYDHTGKEIPLDNARQARNPRHAAHAARHESDLRTAIHSMAGQNSSSRLPPVRCRARAILFSAGFVRWDLPGNFDNVHAHPAAPQQVVGRFNYSMPFPALSEYHCAFSLFNPNDDDSYGIMRAVDRLGRTVAQRQYQLRPHQTMLFTMADLKAFETPGEAFAVASLEKAPLHRAALCQMAAPS